MKRVDFLRDLLPEGGFYYAATWVVKPEYARGGLFKHTAHDDVAQLSLDVKAISNAHGEAYFALASYAEPSYTDQTGKVRYRTKENAVAAKSFWLDIDCGEDKPYTTQASALRALVTFLRECGLAMPTYIVSSGGGLHVYWVTEKPIKAQLWTRIAQMLKAVTKAKGLKVDQSRTSDIASVLRPIGTDNWKRDYPRPVKILKQGPYLQLRAWANRLQELTKELGVEVHNAAKPTRKKNTDLLGDTQTRNYAPSDAHQIAERCPTIAAMRDHKGANQTEPLWYACIGVLGFTEQGHEICHEWSQGHPGYDDRETQLKIEHRMNQDIGPTTCKYMRYVEGNSCEGCTRTCIGPLQLGRPEPESATEEVVGEDEETGIAIVEAIPEMPGGMGGDYKWNPSMGGLTQMVESKDNADERYPVLICTAYPTIEYIFTDSEGEHWAHVVTRTRPGVWEGSDIKTSALAQGGQALMGALGGRAGIVTKNSAGVTKYMQTWFDQMRKDQELQVMRNRMGWQNDGSFVLGSQRFLPNGDVKPCTLSKEMRAYADAHRPAGNMQTQVDLIAELYNRPFYEPFQFILAASLGSILLSLVHKGPIGIPINLWEPHGGRGKTTVCQAAISLWGDHTGNGQVAHADNITEYAMYVMSGLRRHIPVLIDETTNWDAKKVGNFAYTYSGGVAKVQGTADGSLRDNSIKNWQNFVFMTGNSSVVQKMEAHVINAGPRIARVFEIELPDIKLATDDLDLVRQLWEHHSHIGAKYVRYIVKNRERVEAYVKALINDLNQRIGAETDARYWIHTAACTIAASRFAHKLGLFSWDEERFEHWVREQVRTLRGNKADAEDSPEDTLFKLVEELRPGFLVTNHYGGPGRKAIIDGNFPPPRGRELLGRYLTDTHELYVPIGVVKKWCAANNVGYKKLKLAMQTGGWLKQDNVKRSLTVGINVGRTGQARCWVFQFDQGEVDLQPTGTEDP
jgi:hypothetical protein